MTDEEMEELEKELMNDFMMNVLNADLEQINHDLQCEREI